ncbi:hypothetical protein K432DRAFT_419377 [Lepidopterella palustris CBS 459.81]|uniref:Methyltransferase n=1 Tax=Lepidopterella palustris CBS 459.81 TaxID=1314670 RepID=A0A8E2E2J1_9PEZI|nr:hypothetical protein K432DRAFT_419377 [Lepidopterella palustris CBS 459.81]
MLLHIANAQPGVDDASAVRSTLAFLGRHEKWENEKPYRIRHVPADGFPQTNFIIERHEVNIYDMRAFIPSLSLERNGFEVHRIESKMEYEDFADPQMIMDVYNEEVRTCVKRVLNAKEVHCLDSELRKRHESFPISTGQSYSFGQPNMLTHIDVTLESTQEIIREIYGSAAEEILKGRILCVTVWKPLKGPVRDWPLALCDATTLDVTNDVVPSDVIYRKFVAENCLIHYNKAQKWYYLGDQDPSEVLIFKAVDSESDENARCAHGSFPLPLDSTRGEILPRESIDARVLVMYADMQYPEVEPWST